MDGLGDLYGSADPVFYDTPARIGGVFEAAARPLPDGWQQHRDDTWIRFRCPGHPTPAQGWKIHVSATPENADRIVDTVWDYCVRAGIPFKFLANRGQLLLANSKLAARGSSGKLVTIYPADTEELRRILDDLSVALDGEPGPYILSDLRWGAGPLYVRYGGFVQRFGTSATGELVHAIARPDGTLVPDERKPVFTVPDWVTVPDFFAPHLAARDARPDYFPYQVDEAIHFSNGGGVYLATRVFDGQQVVLKEARPYAGLDGLGRDAVQRLTNERQAMQRLAGVPGVPAVHEHFTVWEHHFLAVERMAGDTLQRWLAERFPLLEPEPDPERVADFTERALRIVERIQALVSALHERGIAFGDLHPNNILIGPDDEPGLVDFELAGPVDEVVPMRVGAAGFVAPPGLPSGERDRYALAALRLWIFLPLVALHELCGPLRERHIDVVAERFPVPDAYLARLREFRMPAGPLPDPPDVDLADEAATAVDAARSVAAGIVATATPHRTDRLFPGDPQQFEQGGASFAHGAAGVLWALDVTGHGRHPRHERWLLDAAATERHVRPGFYGGHAGTAYALLRLGHAGAALDLLDRTLPAAARVRDVGLFDGLPGIGLNLLHVARHTGESRYLDANRSVREALTEIVATGQGVRINLLPERPARTPAEGGLLWGWSGAALYFTRLYEHTGDGSCLDLAVRALHRDLALCADGPNGSLVVHGGFRSLSYLSIGGAGIALVAHEVLRHRADQRIAEALPRLLVPARTEYVAAAQLFQGRAGLLAVLARLGATRPDPADRRVVDQHVHRFDWHAMSWGGHLAFPGSGTQPRLSADLATGAAGVLLGLAAATEPGREFLPFLDPWDIPSPTTSGVPAAGAPPHNPPAKRR